MCRADNFGKQIRVVAFAGASGLVLFCAGGSVTFDKPTPVPPPSDVPQLVQIPWDVETGKPRNLVVGFPGTSEPTAPTVQGLNSTNVYISVEMQGLIDFLESLND